MRFKTFGLSHVDHIGELKVECDDLIFLSSWYIQLPIEQKQVKFIKEPVSLEPLLPSQEVMASLLKYSLQYTEAVQNDFNKNRWRYYSHSLYVVL